MREWIVELSRMRFDNSLTFPMSEAEFYAELLKRCSNTSEIGKKQLYFAMEGYFTVNNGMVSFMDAESYEKLTKFYFEPNTKT